MKLNKILALLIAFAMIFSFTACNNAANPAPDNTNQGQNQNNNSSDNTTNEEEEEEEEEEREIQDLDEGEAKETAGPIYKVCYADLPAKGQTWKQPNKFQFGLDGFNVKEGDKIDVIILPLARADLETSLIRSTDSTNSYTKFLPTTSTLITKGEWTGWYEMSCTALENTSGIIFTFYNKEGQDFQPGPDSEVKWPVYVAQVLINGKLITLTDIEVVTALGGEIEAELLNKVPKARLDANIAENPDAPEHEPTAPSAAEETTPSEGTGDGESTETPAEGSAE